MKVTVGQHVSTMTGRTGVVTSIANPGTVVVKMDKPLTDTLKYEYIHPSRLKAI